MAGYDAVTDKRKRTAPRSVTKSEDDHLDVTKRRKLTATARDQERNIALAAWMIRKHLEYVSVFDFQATTKDETFNDALEAFIADASHASNFDVTGRHWRQQAMTMLERRAVVDGDMALLKLRTGHVQAIEGDRIATPRNLPDEYKTRKFSQGIETNSFGRPTYYCLCVRDGTQVKFDRVVRAASVLHHGYFTRFDQYRGVSPLSTAINQIQDLYEAWDYNLVKAKLHALFGIAITKKLPEGIGGFPVTESAGEEEETVDADGVETQDTREHWLKPGVASILDLDDGEGVETIESKTPSAEFGAYSELIIKVAMLALDIPWIFFDALRGSYSVHRNVAIQYEKSAAMKREGARHIHNAWAVWRIALADELGEFRLPRGWTMADVTWEWQPAGTPWIDPLKEVVAAGKEIAAGLNSPQRICKRRGRNFKDIIDEISDAQIYAQSKGVDLSFVPKPAGTTNGN